MFRKCMWENTNIYVIFFFLNILFTFFTLLFPWLFSLTDSINSYRVRIYSSQLKTSLSGIYFFLIFFVAMVPDCPRVLSVRISFNNTHYSVYSTHLTPSCVQMKFYFSFCLLLQLFNNNLKNKIPVNNVFLYSFIPSSFFLILERIQLLNRSTLCSIDLVLFRHVESLYCILPNNVWFYTFIRGWGPAKLVRCQMSEVSQLWRH